MSEQPLVSIGVPCYNSEATLAETLESILRQTYRNFRVTVVDNASKDRTAGIAADFAKRDSRFRVTTFDKNVGYAENWTRCIELAEGDYSSLLFADDVYREDIVEREVRALESCPEAGAVLTNSYVIDEGGRVLSERRLPEEIFSRYRGLLCYQEGLQLLFKHASYFMTPSLMARTSFFKNDLGFFDASIPQAADLDAFLRMLQKRPILFLPDPLIYNRLSVHGYSYEALKKKTTLNDLFLVVDRHLQAGADALLTDMDRNNYAYLRLKDEIRCAVNGILQGDRAAARDMTRNVFSRASWSLCAGRLGRTSILGVGASCRLLSFVPLPGFVKAWLFKLRFGRLGLR